MQSATAALDSSQILKRDKRGRVWVKPRRREALLDEFEKSGLSGAQFARLTGVNYSSFQNWVQRRRQKRGAALKTRPPKENAAGSEPLRIFEAVVETGSNLPRPAPMAALPTPGAVGLLIELPGGCRMSIETPVQMQLAAEFLALIAQRTRARC